jgi:hypothetical protein
VISIYLLATAALVGAATLTIGCLAGLIAERHGQTFRWWFAGGAACVIAATQLPPQPQLVLAAVPVAAAILAPDLPNAVAPFGRSRVLSWWWLRILVIALAGLGVASCSLITMSSIKRTASAPASVVKQMTVAVDTGPRGETIYRTLIEYTFVVERSTHHGLATRRMSRDFEGWHVCYDPGNPAASHSLQPPGFACGGLDFAPTDS